MTSTETHEKFMRAALVEARKSTNEGNQGVGGVIVRDGQIVAKGRNLENTTHDPTTHAETVAIQKFSKTHGSGDLSGTVVYTTFEPCPMCCGAILTTGASTIVMGGRPEAGSSRWGDYTLERLIELTGWSDRIQVVTGILVDDCVNVRS
jgi:tRNA(adenine34) deaminase